MSQLGVTIDDVSRAIQGENAEIPGGALQAGGMRFNLRTTGSYSSVEEVADTIVAAAGTSVVYVRDVADVAWAEEEHVYTTRFNGARAVFITANQRDGQNVFDVRDGIMKQVQVFSATLPGELQLLTGFDQTEAVAKRLNQLGLDFLIAVSLVLLTLLPLGLRAALVVMFSIPMSLALGIWLLHHAGFHAEPVVDRGLRALAGAAGRRLHRGGRKHLPGICAWARHR